MEKFKEKLSKKIFLILAFTSLSALGAITIFIFIEGAPIIAREGLFGFVTGNEWSPAEGKYGILPMIAGTVSVAVGAGIIGIPIGICCAIFLAEYAPTWMQKFFMPAIHLLAGIPSVIYGFWGMMFVVPIIRENFGGGGPSILSASIVLSIMILPTIISVSEASILAVPNSYKEGAFALGATQWQVIWSVSLPAAKSGIVTAVILGLGRAIGETLAVVMVLGNAIAIPTSILDPARTLTANIELEMGYAYGEHRQALFATGIILFVAILILNIIAQYVAHKKVDRTNKFKQNT